MPCACGGPAQESTGTAPDLRGGRLPDGRDAGEDPAAGRRGPCDATRHQPRVADPDHVRAPGQPRSGQDRPELPAAVHALPRTGRSRLLRRVPASRGTGHGSAQVRRAAIACSAVAAAAALTAPAHGRPATAIRVSVLRLVDHSRVAHFQNGATAPRVLVAFVRYPARAPGPLPLIVFAHGFALTPNTYATLLDAWARAGYVVAAPAFPVERANAPGGPSESDLVNEPGDLRFVISSLIDRPGPLRRLIDPTKVGVAGQSDGAVAALSAAYDSRF